jgi:hypothetical protein
MPGALTDDAEIQVLKFLVGADNQGTANHQPGTPAVGPVLPLRVRLTTTVGDDTTPGTQVVAGSSGYTPQIVVFGSTVTNGSLANASIVRFDNMPEVVYVEGSGPGAQGGVRGFEIWDSAGTPKRWWFAALTNPRGYSAGDAAEFPSGELVLAID